MDLICPWEPARFLILSSNVPTLLYYSHFVAIIAALIFSLVLFSQRKGSLSVKLFLFGTLAFTAWSAIDVLLWASNRADLVMFYWSLQVLLEVFMFGSAFYFAYTFITKKDLGIRPKMLLVALIAPVVALLPTDYMLPGIDVSYCNAIESSFLFYYVYTYEILMSLGVVFFALRGMIRSSERRGEIAFFALGILIYLLAFSSGNIIGSITEDWALAQIGLFGMPVFIAFLAYSVVRFSSFNIKLISSQALVTTIWLLTLAILFIRKIENVRVIVAFTLILFTVLGYQLIKSVKREVSARELIEKQKNELEATNARLKELDVQKTEFLSFATHQIRSPLTSMKGYASLILEGDVGPINEEMRKAIHTILGSANTLSHVVEDYLNVTRMELGTMRYDLKTIDFKDVLTEVIAEQKPNIESKGLAFNVSVDQAQQYPIKADTDKFKQVLMNVVDNSVKYTLKGSIFISLEKDLAKHVVRFKVVDTGVGIAPEVMPKLFRKFSRAKNASEANIHGTGLGLFIAREVVTAHGGKLWAESEGEGKGSTFIVEVPEVG